ncbi:MAG: CCA tRNA nucleotidyltransferase [Candidatus Omnitrophica bacterium]|nr:CCA tRNA nucleotidyltransferase [Candidatus Omnitrophota bacterium]
MRKYFKKLPLELKEIISQAAKVSQEIQMPAYLVGGCLRDLILGVKNFDLDITVEGDGIIFAQHLARKLKSRLKIYVRFGTATLILNDRLKVDIATTRQEKYPYSAALPVVSSGSLKEDLKRRDFTINALALSLVADKQQKIIDPFGARADLALGRIRILHNLSFKDDPTRILRAIRFSQRLDFKIEPKTLALLKEAISAGALDKVNPHRMRDELILILKEQNPFGPIKQLGDLGALSFISTKLKIGKSTQGLFKSITKQINWFVKNFPARRQLDSWLVYFAALLETFTLPEIKVIICRLGLPKGDQKRVISYYQERDKLISSLSKKRRLPEQIFSLLEPLSYETIILLGAVSQNKNLKKHLADFLEIYNGMRLCICGDDLRGLGVLPGKEYQMIFAKVLAAKLNGQVRNRQAELALIRKLLQANK